ncbi:hypothetical protein F5B19DRAFT_494056 [Rostrohypoxylon terebratum]|nr:hypothetical protein F5B19DRAFT_494056 [Rostrohypoxylon terebratum]
MALQNKSLVNTASPIPSNNDDQSTSISQSMAEPYVVEKSDDSYQDDANDPEMLDPQNTQAYGYHQGAHDFRFQKLGELIKTHTAASATKIRAEKPYNDYQSRELHNEHQRSVWQKIREEAEADSNIPTALFSPPRTYIQVLVSRWPLSGHYCCPCDIEEEACEVIEIRAPKDSPDGITKDIFIRKVSDAFYGRAPGAADEATRNDSYKIGDEDDRPVIEELTYMIQSRDSMDPDVVSIMRHIFALTRGIIPKTSV